VRVVEIISPPSEELTVANRSGQFTQACRKDTIDDTLVLIRKQPHFYADISALHYRPWQFYNALIMAKES
jgi:hypothetical protein